MEEVSRLIVNYTAIFIVEGQWVASGVYVNVDGMFGILTANHVAEPVMESQAFALTDNATAAVRVRMMTIQSQSGASTHLITLRR